MIARIDDRFLDKAGAPPLVAQYFKLCRARGRLAHAYVFTGPVGSGKRRFARALAKAFFCPSGEPCDECPSCHAIDNGNHGAVDVFGVQERKASMDIVQVRRLSERDHRRHRGLLVSIIEDAQSLDPPAMNALLKTLEEPSPGALLILTCPSTGSLLPTVVSRCHRLQFPSAPETGTELDAELWRGLAAIARPSFHAEHNLREWLQTLFPDEGDLRHRVGAFLEIAIRQLRATWTSWERDPASVRLGGDPLRSLEVLASLRQDLDRYVNADLVLEEAVRRLRGVLGGPG